jgi:hypothetical protein
MATEQDIGWASYREFEGPFYRGKATYRLPDNPTQNDRVIAVITATEGGHYDAYNGYDRCICTSGLIQWCEAGQYSVSDMLGKVAGINRDLLSPVDIVCLATSHVFQTNEKNRFRFFSRTQGLNEVDTTPEQQRLFLLNSSGRKGSWDDMSRKYAKRWAAAISTVWEQPEAQAAQLSYTVARLQQFILPPSKTILDAAPTNGLGMALRAAFLSYAANNPTWASRSLVKAASEAKSTPYSIDWVIAALKEMTFGFGIAIYPIRYKAIRPVLERLYDVDLPDFADELKTHLDGQPPSFAFDTAEVQQALISLGFDLGPAGADGKYGNKTRDALLSFEQQDYGETNKIPVDHVDGQYDEWTAKKLEEVLAKRGVESLSSLQSSDITG